MSHLASKYGLHQKPGIDNQWDIYRCGEHEPVASLIVLHPESVEELKPAIALLQQGLMVLGREVGT